MQTIELKNGTQVGLDELLRSMSKLETADLKKMLEHLNRLVAQRNNAAQAGEQDARLVRQIKQIIPASVVRRFRQLQKKQQAGTLAAKEREEMLVLTDFIEEKSAERVLLLGVLAELRKMEITELAKQLRLNSFHA